MYRTIEMLCLIVSIEVECLLALARYRIFRSRVISCHSRAIGQKSSNFRLLARFIVIFIFQYTRYGIQYGMIGNLRPDRGMMMRYMYGNRTVFLVS